MTNPPSTHDERASLVGERLSLASFYGLSGSLAGTPFVKVLVDRPKGEVHFLRHARHPLHSGYVTEHLGDGWDDGAYCDPARRFFLGTVAYHQRPDRNFFSLEIADNDDMTSEMIASFYRTVREHLDPGLPLHFKPVSHAQEARLATPDAAAIPRVYLHELFAAAEFLPLNYGIARGRLRYFDGEERFKQVQHTLKWYDIIVMDRVPDSIPRLLGIIHSSHVTPLSHTNILAGSWQIPNAVQLGIKERIRREALDGEWVEYAVQPNSSSIFLKRIDRPVDTDKGPAWSVYKIRLEPPETRRMPVASLADLRMSEKYRYGTKAANLGELSHVLAEGSERLLGFYRVRRGTRPNLLPHLAKFLKAKPDDEAEITRAAASYLRGMLRVPRGIALPFSTMREFLESSAQIQQTIGKLKMALELDAPVVDPLAISLQQLLRATRMPETIRQEIDSAIALHLPNATAFVVRSSSNAEDLEGFSAAGLYESVNRVTTVDAIYESIKRVWASLLSPRSIRLRHDVGISLEDSYMGVILQEELETAIGGVLVTTNPMNRGDFRDVYFNLSRESVVTVVQGDELPYQCLYNVVEGGGRTLSLGERREELSDPHKQTLEKLAFAGKLLQSHFSPDYTFSAPLDVEWLANDQGVYVLQVRPYAR